jgi:hypothetical protein
MQHQLTNRKIKELSKIASGLSPIPKTNWLGRPVTKRIKISGQYLLNKGITYSSAGKKILPAQKYHFNRPVMITNHLPMLRDAYLKGGDEAVSIYVASVKQAIKTQVYENSNVPWVFRFTYALLSKIFK